MTGATQDTGLNLIAWLFGYPDGSPGLPPLPVGLADPARTIVSEMQATDPIRMQNEYTRLFINALPEVPCAPYGSLYLEGRIMGDSAIEVREIYRRYGLAPQELPDHIAVESEFLAWLQAPQRLQAQARDDYVFLLGHLRQWTPAFFDCVEHHDQLGCFRRAAGLARTILKRAELC